MYKGRFGLASVCFLCGPALLACAAQVQKEPSVSTQAETYMGALDASEVRIAVVRAGAKLEAYVCGTGATLESHTRWFMGSLDATGAAEISVEGWTLRVGAQDQLRGELEAPSGELQTWTADAIEHDASSEVGLYDARETGCRSGVIVWQAIKGPSCKAQGAWCDASGVRGQVTPLVCTAQAALQVQGVRDGMTFDFTANRVLAP
jgi:hypothetical protein